MIQDYYENIKRDSMSYRSSIDKHYRKEYQYRETEYQRHHSRRYLTTAMSIIAMEKPLFQLFTSPKAVKFLWGLDVSIRSDVLYENILPLLPNEISQIPSARTGKVFGNNEDIRVDSGRSASHQYGNWLRNDLRSFIDKEMDLDLLNSMGIFNNKSLEKVYELWPRAGTNSINKLDSTISWLTAFSMFIKKYKLGTNVTYKKGFRDRINSLIIPPKIWAYQVVKNKLKK